MSEDLRRARPRRLERFDRALVDGLDALCVELPEHPDGVDRHRHHAGKRRPARARR